MKKRVLLVVLLAVALGIGAWYQQWNGNGNGEPLTLYGNVDIREVQLGFRVAGRLQAMNFEEGDAVQAGELLASLDDQPMRESLAVAEARVLEARARLDRFNTGSSGSTIWCRIGRDTASRWPLRWRRVCRSDLARPIVAWSAP